ncbi:MAG: PorT family protein [Bacteroidales bacterium]|nr:MAG: PorT family protein [Bacteroidales bacterium]
MKKKVLILVGLLSVTIAYGQIDFGIKAGLNTSWIRMDDVVTVQDDIEEYSLEGVSNASVGFHGGFMLRITIFSAYLQPEIYFSSTSGEVLLRDVYNYHPDRSEWTEELEFNRIDIPVMLGYKLGPARIQAGPVASILISDKADLLDFSGYDEKYNTATFGYQAGLGFDFFKKLTLDIRYEGNLSRLGDTVKIGGASFDLDTRTSQLLVSLGLLF